jgi:death-on-curing family protein
LSKKSPTVAELANQLEYDPEALLVDLWDAGIERPASLDARLRADELATARRLLGLPSPAQLRKRSYWEERLNMTPAQFEDFMASLDIYLSSRANTLPKGSIKRIRKAISSDVDTSQTSVNQASVNPGAKNSPRAQRRELMSPPKAPEHWPTIGRESDIHLPSAEELFSIHEKIAEDSRLLEDPIHPPGVRDQNLLHSALFRPTTSFGEVEKYPTIEMACAALSHSLVANHPFYNGNKRTALVTLLSVLDRNNMILDVPEEELFRFIVRVAQHDFSDTGHADAEVLDIADWLRRRTRPIQKYERPLKWRELKQILRERFGCEFEVRKGNRIFVKRQTTELQGRLLRRKRTVTLYCHTHYPDDGREVQQSQLKQIRSELQLDEEHDVDSDIFYADARELDDFIGRYRKVLRELAKV